MLPQFIIEQNYCGCEANISKLFPVEVLADPSIAVKLADTKAAGEVKALDDFYTMLQTDPDRAYYGYISYLLIGLQVHCLFIWIVPCTSISIKI